MGQPTTNLDETGKPGPTAPQNGGAVTLAGACPLPRAGALPIPPARCCVAGCAGIAELDGLCSAHLLQAGDTAADRGSFKAAHTLSQAGKVTDRAIKQPPREWPAREALRLDERD